MDYHDEPPGRYVSQYSPVEELAGAVIKTFSYDDSELEIEFEDGRKLHHRIELEWPSMEGDPYPNTSAYLEEA